MGASSSSSASLATLYAPIVWKANMGLDFNNFWKLRFVFKFLLGLNLSLPAEIWQMIYALMPDFKEPENRQFVMEKVLTYSELKTRKLIHRGYDFAKFDNMERSDYFVKFTWCQQYSFHRFAEGPIVKIKDKHYFHVTVSVGVDVTPKSLEEKVSRMIYEKRPVYFNVTQIVDAVALYNVSEGKPSTLSTLAKSSYSYIMHDYAPRTVANVLGHVSIFPWHVENLLRFLYDEFFASYVDND